MDLQRWWPWRRQATTPRLASVRCANPRGLHRMAYVEWGESDNPRVLVAVHGLTRNGRDFDDMARALSHRYRVVCPDVVGRGLSDWLPDAAGYQLPQYVSDMMVLLARLGVDQVDWLGTSMGGLIGMVIAAQPATPVRRLLLNDVGPVVSAASLRRIGEYVGRAPQFPDYAAAETYIRAVSAQFGSLSDAQWRQLTETSIKPLAQGGYALRYDPAIGQAFRDTLLVADLELWSIYDAIRCPTLVLRGETSDLLSRDTVAAMQQRGPRAGVAEIKGAGHAPALMDAAQLALVRAFFGA